MTWRAFLLGLLAAAGICLLEAYSVAKGYGFFTNSCFPGGAVLVLVVAALGLNSAIKLVRRAWSLTQAELMLVWCMGLVACAIPNEGLGSFWYGVVAGGPYMARRTDLAWEDDGALTAAPADLVLSKDPKSTAALQYFQGSETARVPWKVWIPPLARWALFLGLMYAAIFFGSALLRRQWVEVERLTFPLARIPLELTDESGGGRSLLPPAFSDKALLAGIAFSAAFRFLRASPLIFGSDSGWGLNLPLAQVFSGTPLESMSFQDCDLWYIAIGFAYLVPADVSLSVWFFYLFSRCELLVGHWLALPATSGGSWSPLIRWQQLGATLALVAGMLYIARRHLKAVVTRALCLSRSEQDADEPVRYPVAFWGFVLSLAGCSAWYWHYGMGLPIALAAMVLVFCWYMTYARIVAQGGVYVARISWSVTDTLHGLTGRLSPPGAVMTSTVDIFLGGATIMLAPVAMDTFRISSVFERGRKLFVPALMSAILIALVATSYMVLTQAYSMGALNFSFVWAAKQVPITVFEHAQRIITQPSQSAEFYWGSTALGAALTGAIVFMRARFYWWPVHPIGFLTCSSWHSHRPWIPFLLGWVIKVSIMRFSGGHMLRSARTFFIAFIITESFINGVSALTSVVTKGAVPLF